MSETHWEQNYNAMFAKHEELRLRCASLEAALRAVEVQWKKPGEWHSEYFERQAERFYRETGLIAPGKSVPLESASVDNEVERHAKWTEFFERPRALMDAALSPGPSPALRALIVEAVLAGIGDMPGVHAEGNQEVAEAIADRLLKVKP